MTRRLAIVTARLGLALLYSLPLLFLAIFFFYPLFAILRLSLTPHGGLEWAVLAANLGQPSLWRIFWFTCWQAAVSTGLTLALGLPLAYCFARFQFPGKSVLRALTTIPFVMPTVVVAAAFTALLGSSGLLNSWLQAFLHLDQPPIALNRTIWIILLAHAFYNVSVVVRTVGGFWANLNPRLEEAAAVLGASPLQLLRTVTLPLLAPSIVAASLLIFLFCFTSFGVVLILGGLRFATLEVEIYRQTVSYFNLPMAALLSVVQLLCTFGVMAVYTRMQARASLPLELRSQASTARPARGPGERIGLAVGLSVMLLVLLAPLVTLAVRSFTLGDGPPTLDYYRELGINRRQSAFFVAPTAAIANSLLYAVATVGLSVFLGVISAYLLARPQSRLAALLDPIFLLPLGTSAVTLGLGYIVALGPLRTSPWLVPVAHTLVAAPFVVRTLLPALRSLNPRLREAGAVLGAPPWRVWWEVDVPLLFRALLVGAVFAFTISLGEFGATLLIGRPDRPTMPVVIYRALNQPGLLNYGQALAMSTLLMGVSALGILVIERFRIADLGEF